LQTDAIAAVQRPGAVPVELHEDFLAGFADAVERTERECAAATPPPPTAEEDDEDDDHGGKGKNGKGKGKNGGEGRD
jgi:hypothetical protein